MSFKAMLAHRCSVLELQEEFVDGVPRAEWITVATNVPCFLDLNFIRKGKDPVWTQEAGRRSDRTGVLFAKSPVIKSGHRLKMTVGPSGTFQVEGATDEAWRPTKRHHMELGVTEVPSQISKGKGPQ